MSEVNGGFPDRPRHRHPYDDGSEMEKGSQPYPGIQDGHLVDGGPGNTEPAS